MRNEAGQFARTYQPGATCARAFDKALAYHGAKCDDARVTGVWLCLTQELFGEFRNVLAPR